jgi:hypothetical protein
LFSGKFPRNKDLGGAVMHAAVRPYVTAASALVASSLVAVTPVVPPPDLHVANQAVRLLSGEGALGALSSIDPLANLGGLTSDLTNLGGSLFGDGSLLNIPYNIFADIVNIPYYESLALQEYAYALGPAGQVGGVPGWIPPGATVDNGGVVGDLYALGGTGSWWQESMGNTWGWDNGNWPQVDALIHFLLPFQWTEGITTSIQSVAQSAFIDGSAVNCEFECANVVGYLGGWLTNLGNVFNSTYPITQTDTIGSNFPVTGVPEVINVGPPGFEETAIWSGQQVPFNPLLEPFQAIWQNATASPGSDPIMLPDITNVFDSAVKLGQDLLNDFNPFIQGSFLYWGAPTLYSVPALIGGLVNTFSLGLIPNEFANTAIGWPANGAMPFDGYTMGPASLPGNLAEGFQYLANGLLSYLDPATYFAGANAGAATDASATALGSLGDPTALLGDLNSLMPNFETDLSPILGTNLGADLASILGTNLGADLASMFPQLTADLSSWFPDLASALIP